MGGTLEDAGLTVVFDLAGRTLQDVRPPASPHPDDEPGGEAAPSSLPRDQDEVNEATTAYRLATWKSPTTGQVYVFASRRHRTAVAMLRLESDGDRPRHLREVLGEVSVPSAFRLPDGTSWSPCEDAGEGPQVEGMVVDVRELVPCWNGWPRPSSTRWSSSRSTRAGTRRRRAGP